MAESILLTEAFSRGTEATNMTLQRGSPGDKHPDFSPNSDFLPLRRSWCPEELSMPLRTQYSMKSGFQVHLENIQHRQSGKVLLGSRPVSEGQTLGKESTERRQGRAFETVVTACAKVLRKERVPCGKRQKGGQQGRSTGGEAVEEQNEFGDVLRDHRSTQVLNQTGTFFFPPTECWPLFFDSSSRLV